MCMSCQPWQELDEQCHLLSSKTIKLTWRREVVLFTEDQVGRDGIG